MYIYLLQGFRYQNKQKMSWYCNCLKIWNAHFIILFHFTCSIILINTSYFNWKCELWCTPRSFSLSSYAHEVTYCKYDLSTYIAIRNKMKSNTGENRIMMGFFSLQIKNSYWTSRNKVIIATLVASGINQLLRRNEFSPMAEVLLLYTCQ